MEKDFTLFSNASFNSHSEKDLKEKTLLDIEMGPSGVVINNILSFSKVLKIEKSREVGLIEIVLN